MDMGLAEDLSRLAELKESGVLTQQEFDRQKKRLLNGGKSGPSKLMQFTAGLIAFMIIGSFAYKGVEKLAETAAEDDLLCDSPEVRETAVNVLNQQIAEAKNQLGILGGLIPSGAQIHGIRSATELYRDKESGFIACLAMARNEKGEGQVAYTVSWQDRAAGKFWVELANPDQLRKQYSGESNETAEVAPAPPKSPREELLDVLAEMKKSKPPEEFDDAAHDTPPPTTAGANSDSEESVVIGRCLLEVGGKKYIDGECPINMSPDGSFSIGAAESAPLKFFATVGVTGKGLAEGHWNEEEGANHAHTPLGELKFNRGCWQNGAAKICAWKQPEQRSGKAVAHWEGDGDRVTLFDKKAPGLPCADFERVATLRRTSGETVEGCWASGNDSVAIKWKDEPKAWEFLTSEFTAMPGYKWN
jgi:Short C-terminal domain